MVFKEKRVTPFRSLWENSVCLWCFTSCLICTVCVCDNYISSMLFLVGIVLLCFQMEGTEKVIGTTTPWNDPFLIKGVIPTIKNYYLSFSLYDPFPLDLHPSTSGMAPFGAQHIFKSALEDSALFSLSLLINTPRALCLTSLLARTNTHKDLIRYMVEKIRS